MNSFKRCQNYEEHETFWKIGGSWNVVQNHEEPEKVWKIWRASNGVKNEKSIKGSEK